MDFRCLRSFVMLADTLHFGRAAEQLHLAQPALTQHIQRLERDLGVRLLERGPRHVRLTVVGLQFLVEARQILAQVERAALIAARVQRGEVGCIEVGYISSMAYSGVLPELLQAFEQIAPEVIVNLVEADQQSQLEDLEQGRLDLALLRLPIGLPRRDLQTIILRRETVVACVPANHPLPRPVLALQSLAGQPFLATHLGDGCGFYDTALKLCRAAGFEPRIVSRSQQFATIVALVAAGRGVALVPESVSKLSLPGVRFAALEDCPLTTDLVAVHGATEDSPATLRLLQLCAEFESRR